MTYLIDPRDGDAEDDSSSTKKRPILAIAGSMLAELSPAKFILTWIIIVAAPALTIGMIPPIASAWLTKVSDKTLAFSGIGSVLIIVLLGRNRMVWAEAACALHGGKFLVAELDSRAAMLRAGA